MKIAAKISIATTLYNSAEHIDEFYERCIINIARKFDDYEFVIVNDGSPDDSLLVAKRIAEQDKKVKIVDLSRNFGHHKALLTSIDFSNGDYIYMTDVDLEEEPELFSEFWNKLNSEKNTDVVYATQISRKGNWFEIISGDIFYKTFNALSSTAIPKNIVTTRLMTKKYAKALSSFKEQEVFIAGLAILAGYNAVELKITKLSTSKSSYSLSKRIDLLVNGITSFTAKPLYFIFIIGLAILLLTMILTCVILAQRIFWSVTISGWTSLIILGLFSTGVITFSIGITAIYLSKIFSEVKNRPYVIVRETINHEQ